MRILFHGPGLATHRAGLPLPFFNGAQPVAATNVAELTANHWLTGNRGNLIHAEAPAKMFRKASGRSGYANIAVLKQQLGDRYQDVMARNFDRIVISMANFIRPTNDGAKLAAAIEALDGGVDIVVLGAGLQGEHTLADMPKGNRDLLAILNERALVFGLRGEETGAWLAKYGFHNHAVLGCPSLYAYPAAILSIDPAQARVAGASARVMTAGYLKMNGKAFHERGAELLAAFRGLRAAYVLQDEFLTFDAADAAEFVFDEGRQQFDAARLNRLIAARSGAESGFEAFHYFTEAAAWRMAARGFDLYVGDRFHGGVASLQAGAPAVFLCHDNRVRELTDFFGLPALTTAEFAKMGLAGTIDACCSDEVWDGFKAIYRQRHADFRAAMAKVGLEMADLPRTA